MIILLPIFLATLLVSSSLKGIYQSENNRNILLFSFFLDVLVTSIITLMFNI